MPTNERKTSLQTEVQWTTIGFSPNGNILFPTDGKVGVLEANREKVQPAPDSFRIICQEGDEPHLWTEGLGMLPTTATAIHVEAGDLDIPSSLRPLRDGLTVLMQPEGKTKSFPGIVPGEDGMSLNEFSKLAQNVWEKRTVAIPYCPRTNVSRDDQETMTRVTEDWRVQYENKVLEGDTAGLAAVKATKLAELRSGLSRNRILGAITQRFLHLQIEDLAKQYLREEKQLKKDFQASWQGIDPHGEDPNLPKWATAVGAGMVAAGAAVGIKTMIDRNTDTHEPTVDAGDIDPSYAGFPLPDFSGSAKTFAVLDNTESEESNGTFLRVPFAGGIVTSETDSKDGIWGMVASEAETDYWEKKVASQSDGEEVLTKVKDTATQISEIAQGDSFGPGEVEDIKSKIAEVLSRYPDSMVVNASLMVGMLGKVDPKKRTVVTVLILGSLLAACDDTAIRIAEVLPVEVTPSPLIATGTADSNKTPTPPDVVPSEVPLVTVTSTPTSEPQVVCPENPQEFLFENELNWETGMMVPVMSADRVGVFGEKIPEDLFDRVADDIVQVIRANPGSINRIVYPEYLQFFDNTDMLARVMQKLGVYGVGEVGVSLIAFSRDNQANLGGEDTIWEVVHSGAGGATTIPWKNPRVGQRQDTDKTSRILGDMMTVTDTNSDGNLELRTLSGSRLYGSPDVAQIPGCSPVIIQTTPDGLHVTAALEDEPDFSDPDTLWDLASNVELREYLSPEAGPEEMVNKVNELIDNGFDVTWEEREDGNLDLYLPSQIENDAEESEERILFATAEVESGSFKITTAMNEPYRLDGAKLTTNSKNLIINDELGDQLLEWKDGGWKAEDGRILYLAAGENYIHFEHIYYPNFGNIPNDINEKGPITGVTDVVRENQREFQVILIDKNTVGFYDPNGYLFQYKVIPVNYYQKDKISVCLENLTSTVCTANYTSEEVIDLLDQWSQKLKNKQIGIDIHYEPQENNYGFLTDLINAIESGNNYPNSDEGFIPMVQLIQQSPVQ